MSSACRSDEPSAGIEPFGGGRAQVQFDREDGWLEI
jgi:hypothetical protein